MNERDHAHVTVDTCSCMFYFWGHAAQLVGSCVCVLSCVQLFATPRTVAHQAPLSMGFPRQEPWSRLPFPSPGDLSNPGIKPKSFTSRALAGGLFTSRPPRILVPLQYSCLENPRDRRAWWLTVHEVTKSRMQLSTYTTDRCVCHAQWSQSERKKQVSYINTCMWNLEKQYRWTYFQGRNRKKDLWTHRGKGWVRCAGRDSDWHIYTYEHKTDIKWEAAV